MKKILWLFSNILLAVTVSSSILLSDNSLYPINFQWKNESIQIEELHSNIGEINCQGKNCSGYLILFKSFGKTFVMSVVKQNISNDAASIFVGRLKGRSGCHVEGYFLDLIPRATISCPDETYYLEPSQLYPGFKLPFNTIAYRKKDAFSSACPFNESYCIWRGLTGVIGPVRNAPFNPRLFRREIETPHRQVCQVHLLADHTYMASHRNIQASVLAEMTLLLREADRVFSSTDFNGDGLPDNIGFAIKKMTLFKDQKENNPFVNAGLSAREVLEKLSIFAATDEKFCLSIMFVHRDFAPESTIGLAFTADANPMGSIGGLCEVSEEVEDLGLASTNTAIVTNINKGKLLPAALNSVALTHELGHSFGSSHDTGKPPCSPSDNHIMSASSKESTILARVFSICSILSIQPVIHNKGSCLSPDFRSRCGDGVVQAPEEECDCGNREECPLLDPCCLPEECRLNRSNGQSCSPKVHPCCGENCSPRLPGVICSATGTECREVARCDGTSPACPEADAYPDGTLCAETSKICKQGVCSGAVCEHWGFRDCSCLSPEASLCSVCCEEPTRSICFPAHALGIVINETHRFRRSTGYPCDQDRGFCQSDGTCRRSGLTRAVDTISHATRAVTHPRWLTNNWPFIVLAVFALFYIIVTIKGLRRLSRNNTLLSRFYKAVQITRIKMKDNPRAKGLDLQTFEQAARLSTLFPEVTQKEIFQVNCHFDSELQKVNRLLVTGFPMRVDFRENEK